MSTKLSDLFFKKVDKTDSKQNETEQKNTNNSSNKSTKRGMKAIYTPQSFDDVQDIIDIMKDRKIFSVDLSGVAARTKQRVIDLLTGSVYALGGTISEDGENLFSIKFDKHK